MVDLPPLQFNPRAADLNEEYNPNAPASDVLAGGGVPDLDVSGAELPAPPEQAPIDPRNQDFVSQDLYGDPVQPSGQLETIEQAVNEIAGQSGGGLTQRNPDAEPAPKYEEIPSFRDDPAGALSYIIQSFAAGMNKTELPRDRIARENAQRQQQELQAVQIGMQRVSMMAQIPQIGQMLQGLDKGERDQSAQFIAGTIAESFGKPELVDGIKRVILDAANPDTGMADGIKQLLDAGYIDQKVYDGYMAFIFTKDYEGAQEYLRTVLGPEDDVASEFKGGQLTATYPDGRVETRIFRPTEMDKLSEDGVTFSEPQDNVYSDTFNRRLAEGRADRKLLEEEFGEGSDAPSVSTDEAVGFFGGSVPDMTNAAGLSGTILNSVNAVTDYIGAGLFDPSANEAKEALNTLRVASLGFMSAMFPGRDSNELRRIIDGIIPRAGMGPDAMMERASRTVDFLTEQRAPLLNPVSRETATQTRNRREALSQINSIIGAYNALIENAGGGIPPGVTVTPLDDAGG